MVKGLKIMVIIPTSGLNPSAIKLRKKHLEELAWPGTEIEIDTLEKGPESIQSTYDGYFGAPSYLIKVKEAEEKGFDAIVNHCACDLAMDGAREIANIPVVGLAQSSMLLAAYLGDRFSMIEPVDTLIPMKMRLVRRYGIEAKLASVRAINVPVLELYKDMEKTKRAFLEEARKAIDNDGADVIVPGCGGFSIFAFEMQEKLGVPVIDPGAAGLKMAEMLVRLKLTHSKHAYPKPARGRIK